MKNEIIIYQADSHSERIEVTLENETVWLSLNQIATVFDRDKSVISKHLKNIFKEEELIKNSVVAFFAITATDGKTYRVEHYNLDAILSVGYRVNSKRGTQFRKWASLRLTDYLLKGYAINNRMNRFENQLEGLSNQVNQIEVQIKTKDLPVQGIFMDNIWAPFTLLFYRTLRYVLRTTQGTSKLQKAMRSLSSPLRGHIEGPLFQEASFKRC